MEVIELFSESSSVPIIGRSISSPWRTMKLEKSRQNGIPSTKAIKNGKNDCLLVGRSSANVVIHSVVT